MHQKGSHVPIFHDQRQVNQICSLGNSLTLRQELHTEWSANFDACLGSPREIKNAYIFVCNTETDSIAPLRCSVRVHNTIEHKGEEYEIKEHGQENQEMLKFQHRVNLEIINFKIWEDVRSRLMWKENYLWEHRLLSCSLSASCVPSDDQLKHWVMDSFLIDSNGPLGKLYGPLSLVARLYSRSENLPRVCSSSSKYGA